VHPGDAAVGARCGNVDMVHIPRLV
jgi:hypothetical protein